MIARVRPYRVRGTRARKVRPEQDQVDARLRPVPRRGHHFVAAHVTPGVAKARGDQLLHRDSVGTLVEIAEHDRIAWIADGGEERVGLRLPHWRRQIEMRDEYAQAREARPQENSRLLAYRPAARQGHHSRVHRRSVEQLGSGEQRIAVRATVELKGWSKAGRHVQSGPQLGGLIGARAAAATDVDFLKADDVGAKLA